MEKRAKPLFGWWLFIANRITESSLFIFKAVRFQTSDRNEVTYKEKEMESKTNVVLVHGAWADGSTWSKVISLLDEKKFNVTAVQLPLTSLEDDIAVTRNALAAQKGPTVLVGHSYGGAVVTG